AWGSFVGELAQRYSDVAAIEIWNEPNQVGHWGGQPDADAYTRMLCAAYSAVHANPGAPPVLGGSLSNKQTTDADGVSLPEFLHRIYAAGGRGCMDGISLHTYSWGRGDSLLLKSVS